MAQFRIARPETEAEKTTRTTLDVWEVTPDIVRSWKAPPFQRPLRASAKLSAIAAEIRENDGVIPGVLTLGIFNKERYLIDGQHRTSAYLESGCAVGYVDVRVAHYKTMAEMAEEFFKLNSRISQMKPDDYLRALEASTPLLAKLHTQCPFVGYDQIRRCDRGPVLSMSVALRSWWSSQSENPSSTVKGSIATKASDMTETDVEQLSDVLNLMYQAWRNDPENYRLWNGLNLATIMWLYRRTVVTTTSAASIRLTDEQFKKCLIVLSAQEDYLEWLRGRVLNAATISPCYRRIKETFARRLQEEFGKKVKLPAPEWGGK